MVWHGLRRLSDKPSFIQFDFFTAHTCKYLLKTTLTRLGSIIWAIIENGRWWQWNTLVSITQHWRFLYYLWECKWKNWQFSILLWHVKYCIALHCCQINGATSGRWMIWRAVSCNCNSKTGMLIDPRINLPVVAW